MADLDLYDMIENEDEMRDYLNNLDIKNSYIGSRPPDVEHRLMSALERLEMQDRPDKDYLPEDSGMTKGDRNGRDS